MKTMSTRRFPNPTKRSPSGLEFDMMADRRLLLTGFDMIKIY